MKATKISTVVCLAALMAACSNEEWEANKSNTVLDGRKVVDLELTAGYDEASTRFAVGEGGEFLLTKNDVMGAVIVDPTTLWSVEANKTLGNNRFENTLGEGEQAATTQYFTDGTTVEGSWMFYVPYTADMSSKRDGIFFTDKVSNQKYDPKGETMAANDFRISPVVYVAANEGGVKLNVTPVSIYGYGIITPEFPEGSNVTKVKRVLIQTTSTDKFVVSGKIDASAVEALSALNLTDKEDTDFSNAEIQENALAAYKALGDYSATYATAGDVTGIYQSAGKTEKDYILIDCTEDEAAGVAAAGFTTRVLLPAAKYTNKINVFFYTDNGVYKNEIAANAIVKRGHWVNLANPNRTTSDDAAESTVKDAKMEVTLVSDNSAPIVTTEDLVSVINSANVEELSPATLNLQGKIVGDDVIFTEEVAQALKNNAKVSYVILDGMDVQNNSTEMMEVTKVNVPSGVLTVTGENPVMINSGNTIKGIEVANEANVTYAASYANNAAITSAGTLTIAAANCAGAITLNGGKATFLGAGTAAKALTTTAAVAVNAGAELEVPAGSTWTVSAASTTAVKTATAAAGKITVNGKMTVSAALSNTGEIVNNATIDGTGTITNNGTINNGAEAETDALITAAITNGATGKVNNYARIEKIDNTTGEVVAMKNSFTNFNTNRGTVNNTDSYGEEILNQAAFAGAETSSDVYVTITNETWTNKEKLTDTFPICDRIVLKNVNWTVNDDVTISDYTIDFDGTTLTLNKKDTNTFSSLTLANVNVYGNTNWVSAYVGNQVVIGASKKMTVGNGTDEAKLFLKGLTVAGTSTSSSLEVKANATIDNWGTFNDSNFSSITIDTDGAVTGTPITAKP